MINRIIFFQNQMIIEIPSISYKHTDVVDKDIKKVFEFTFKKISESNIWITWANLNKSNQLLQTDKQIKWNIHSKKQTEKQTYTRSK